MHPSFVLLFLPLGMALLLKLKLRMSLIELLGLGFVVGSLTVALGFYFLEQLSNNDSWMAIGSLLAFGVGSWWLIRQLKTTPNIVSWKGLGLMPLFAYLIWVSQHLLYLDNQGNIIAGWRTVWGDWAAHLSYTTSFVTGNSPAELPILSGHPFSYPFLSDYVSSIFVRLGIDLLPSLVWPSIVAMMAVSLGLVTLSRAMFDKEQPGVIASYLFFTSGGLGWLWWLRDILNHTTSATREYTFLDQYNINWINKFTSELLPQRGLVFALPVTLVLLSLAVGVWRQHKRLQPSNLWPLLLLPLTHVHSLVASVAVLGWSWFVGLKRSHLKTWLGEGVGLGVFTAASIAIVISSYGSALGSGQYLHWQLGWMAASDPWIWFWIINLGAIWIPIFLGHQQLPHRLVWILVPFWSFFVAAQLIRFHPWEYDNTKVMTQWYVIMCLVASWWLWKRWQAGSLPGKILVIVIMLASIASGLKDISLIGQPSSQLQMVSHLDLPAATWAATNLPADSVLATAPVHDHPLIMISGHTAYLGFPGWVWSYGLEYHQRESELKTWYHQGFPSQSEITHVILGPSERSYYQVESVTLTQEAKELYADSRYQIYSLK